MDFLPIIPLPVLIEAGKSVMKHIKPLINMQGYNLPQDLENKIAELEHNKNADEIIALLKDFAKKCNSQTITQTNNGQSAINVAGNNTTISFDSKNQEKPDKNLFKEINDDFPDDFVRFIKKHDFKYSFEDKDTNALSNLLNKYGYPKYSFINEVLKDKWDMLFNSLKNFANCLSLNTRPLRNGKYRVESEDDFETINMLNLSASDVYNKYEDFIVSGKQILNV